MDALDLALMDAWERVGARLLERPWELVKRMERVRRAELRRPVRAWAVGVRASDHRIGDGYSAPAESGRPGRAWGDFGCETSWNRERKGYAHRVTLTGARLAELVKPVRVDEPVDIVEMARRLGRDTRTVVSWRDQGMIVGEKRRVHAQQRAPKWMVKTLGALDPQADGGRRPGAWWGTTWEHHWQRVPAEMWVRLKRVPRLRSARLNPVPRVDCGVHNVEFRRAEAPPPVPEGRPKWVGWDWVCPGRVVVGRGGERVRVDCGRVCKKLWLPLPSWGLGQYLAGRGSAGEAVWRKLAVEGLFGVGLQGVDSGRGERDERGERGLEPPQAALACARCWGLRHEPSVEAGDRLRAEAWNRFVTVLSGGLLYGREVVEPGRDPFQ